MNQLYKISALLVFLLFTKCSQPTQEEKATEPYDFVEYKTVKLNTDLTQLSDAQKAMIPLMIEAAGIMDEIFWIEAYGNKDSLLNSISDNTLKEYTKINYGPWDRLNDNQPFIPGLGEKPLGANYYPQDMTREEFEAFDSSDKSDPYTIIRRDKEGNLMTIPYHKIFEGKIKKASDLIAQCALLAEDPGLKKYLELRANALLTDDYQASDMAWMDMKDNGLDLVIGPIENYEDKLYNYKTAHEAYILIKDKEWSGRLSKYISFLPELQQGLPVDDIYKQDKPGGHSQLNAYDVVYYAGDCNAGAKTIAINLPNDEEVQLKKGSRRLQLKNAMKAKFDEILVPIAKTLIAPDQQKNITFDAFFANTMFHEVAHGLGIKNTLDGKGTVREALKEHGSALEEGKADILGLYMVTKLLEQGELDGNIEAYYTTFMASIFRSIRFGAADAHGVANMIRFNFFEKMGAFTKTNDGYYRVDFPKLKEAAEALSKKILILQGNGDYEGVDQLVNEMGTIGPELQQDLDKLTDKNIPVDVVFEQGVEVLGL